jgi:peptide/nickel transport system substrate-binding protein
MTLMDQKAKPHMATVRKSAAIALAGVAAALAFAGCTGDTTSGGSTGETTSGGDVSGVPIIVGTTDKVTVLDPAGSYDNGSYHIEINVYQFLYAFPPGDPTPTPDAAESCEYIEDTVLRCVLKEGLTFANGHALTASDVKFSFDRMVAINDVNGPSSLLYNLHDVAIVDDLTVDFNLNAGPDQTFLQILATPAGPIVDEEVFSATALTPDSEIVAGNAFSGPYTIDSWAINDIVSLVPYANYNGVQGTVLNDGVTIRYYAESTNMKLAVENGEIDIATRSLTATDIASLRNNSNLTTWEGPGGEIRYIVFNFDTMPGDTAEQKLAIRQAIASVIDRQAVSDEVYQGLYTPLCSFVPAGMPGATEVVCDTYPLSVERAAQYLSDAGVATPVVLNLQYNPDHYGSSSADEYARYKAQLEASGLFTVNLEATEWVQYAVDRSSDVYPLYQLGWFPDYPDADNYLAPFFIENTFLNNHFSDPAIDALVTQEQTTADVNARIAVIEEIQEVMAGHLSTLPLLMGSQICISSNSITGIVLDASFQLRYATVVKA